MTRGGRRGSDATRARTSAPPTGVGRGATLAPVELPLELAKLLRLAGGRVIGDFAPLPMTGAGRAGATTTRGSFASLIERARRSAAARAELVAFLAGTIPFGMTRNKSIWVHAVLGPTSASKDAIAIVDPKRPTRPKPFCRGVSVFAYARAREASDLVDPGHPHAPASPGGEARHGRSKPQRTKDERDLTSAGVAPRDPDLDVAAARELQDAFERAALLADLLVADDARVKKAARQLARRTFEPPHPPPLVRGTSPRVAAKSSRRLVQRRKRSAARSDRFAPFALGPLVEAFFRKGPDDAYAIVLTQRESRDRVVRDAAVILEASLGHGTSRSARSRDLARRRDLAVAACRNDRAPASAEPSRASDVTSRIIGFLDTWSPTLDPLAKTVMRDEALLALSELGSRSFVPDLVRRAEDGDTRAVDMLAAFGDPRAIAPLLRTLRSSAELPRAHVTAVVRALASLGASRASSAVRALLLDNPMPTWREGLDRGGLVKELVHAIGVLGDPKSGSLLVDLLGSNSQEYRTIRPIAARALGRLRYAPAIPALEALLSSPKEPLTCEAIWALGEIARAHASARPLAYALLDSLGVNDPGAEMVRVTALAKLDPNGTSAPRPTVIRVALERALWDPGYRQEDTSRRRTWALRSLCDLAALRPAEPKRRRAAPQPQRVDPYFLGHEAVRYLVTRDDHAVRRAAEQAFAAWDVPVPKARRYYDVVVEEIEARGGLGALHEALRDPLAVFAHNVATRLGERADPSSARPLAEATARLFAEPATSTHEYDDAPHELVSFVCALAKLNHREGNDVLIAGLRSGNHHVRAVVADNVPNDERFVPELMAILGDPRSFVRSRAERSLAAFGMNGAARRPPSDRPTRLVGV